MTENKATELLLKAKVEEDEITKKIGNIFDYNPSEEGVITKIYIPTFPANYNIGLIVGSSGSGKSTILKHAFNYKDVAYYWNNSKSIASNFNGFDEASEKLGAVGLNSIPTWMKPYSVLSNGEQFRADMAIKLSDNAVIDEFTSVVNREVAYSCCISMEKYIRKKDIKNITFASCHDDIIPYLKPDWIYNTDTHEFYNGRYLCRPKINIEIYDCKYRIWDMFKRYHYLSGDINKASKCYLAVYKDLPIAFCAVLPMPIGTVKHAYREHRIVVLPDYQGMGIGNKFSETIADIYHKSGCRYYSKTANPRMGQHRDKSPLWKPTSKNHVLRPDYLKQQKTNYHNMLNNAVIHVNRDCYSHEYIGDGMFYEYSLVNDKFHQMSFEEYFK